MALSGLQLRGIGMTSQRARDRLVQRLKEQGITHPGVLEAIRDTPRHLFVDEALAHRAYEDTALPIGYGQTISQPYVVALMTQAVLAGGTLGRVLEIGTGSGYQAAVLARFAREVITLERIQALLTQARGRFRQLGLHQVKARHSDGGVGWPQGAPYDAIVVTAAPEHLPAGLVEQLAVGGRLVAPLGPQGVQDLVCITRTPEGSQRDSLGRVTFVPFLAGTA